MRRFVVVEYPTPTGVRFRVDDRRLGVVARETIGFAVFACVGLRSRSNAQRKADRLERHA